jgi:hypothetical protein
MVERKNLYMGNNPDFTVTENAKTIAKKVFLKHCLAYGVDPGIKLVYVPQDALMRMLEDVASEMEREPR